ncbi:hypothetical protein FQN50_009348, partial [Emmonsiellopsis sp. PD_5]
SDSKQVSLIILNMFNCNISYIIDGVNIDHPFNAMSLDYDLHKDFGNFSVFFKAVSEQGHTYQINSFLPDSVAPMFPVT